MVVVIPRDHRGKQDFGSAEHEDQRRQLDVRGAHLRLLRHATMVVCYLESKATDVRTKSIELASFRGT